MSQQEKCTSDDKVCPTCKVEHSHFLHLHDLLDKKVEKKDIRLQKIVEEHMNSIQSSLDEGSAKFTKVAKVREEDNKYIHERINRAKDDLTSGIVNTKSEIVKWTEDKLYRRDSKNDSNRRTLIVQLVGITMASVSALIMAIVIFTFLRADVRELKKITHELHEWKNADSSVSKNTEFRLNQIEEELNKVELSKQRCIVIHSQLKEKGIIK